MLNNINCLGIDLCSVVYNTFHLFSSKTILLCSNKLKKRFGHFTTVPIHNSNNKHLITQ